VSKHTPGPWRANGSRVEADALGKQALALCHNQTDARLMALAPELVEGLEDFGQCLVWCKSGYGPSKDWSRCNCGLRALLARVDGGES
jgi:hypothetical protein